MLRWAGMTKTVDVDTWTRGRESQDVPANGDLSLIGKIGMTDPPQTNVGDQLKPIAGEKLSNTAFDACVCIALSCGYIESALDLVVAASSLTQPSFGSSPDTALGRNIANFRKAHDMYPTTLNANLKLRFDAVFASIGQGERCPELATSRSLATLQEEALGRLRLHAIAKRDKWYRAQQVCGTPEELRRRQDPGRLVDAALTEDNPRWHSVESAIEPWVVAIVNAQVANIVASELASRIHPERTIATHTQTDIQRSLAQPGSRHDGPSFDPRHGSLNEYALLYADSVASAAPQLQDTRKLTPLTPEQRQAYFDDPNTLDTAAFIRFFQDPAAFIRGAQLTERATNTITERFAPGIQMLGALFHSKHQAAAVDLVRNQFGIALDVQHLDAAQLELKRISPSNTLVTGSGDEFLTTNNPRADLDRATLEMLLTRVVPTSASAESAYAKEAVRQALQAKISELQARVAQAQAYMVELAEATAAYEQAIATTVSLRAQIDSAKKSTVGKGVAMFGRRVGGGEYSTQEEKTAAINELGDQKKASEKNEAAANDARRRAEGDHGDQSSQKREEIANLEAQIAKLQRILEESS